jgi:hypothetical protein
LRLAPHVEGASKVVERYRFTLAITRSYSQLERAFQIFDCLRLIRNF